mgnify:CR=1 FL=1
MSSKLDRRAFLRRVSAAAGLGSLGLIVGASPARSPTSLIGSPSRSNKGHRTAQVLRDFALVNLWLRLLKRGESREHTIAPTTT